MLSEARGFEMQVTVQQSPASAKPFRSHQITPNLSLQAGGESKYPSGSQSPVLVWLFLGCKDQSPAHSSCTSWFFTARRQQSETGFPDSPGHRHPLTPRRTGIGTLRVKAGKPHFLFVTASQEAQARVCHLTDLITESADSLEKSCPAHLSFQCEAASLY